MEALNFTMLKRGGGSTLVHGARSLMHERFIHARLHKSRSRTREQLAPYAVNMKLERTVTN